MNDEGLEYELPNALGILRLERPVVEHLYKHRQNRPWRREAGGQLFATLQDGVVRIVEATGPRTTDKRTCWSYVPDRAAEQTEIRVRYLEGLHFVGDWHTHRQRLPQPSGTDRDSVADMVRKSAHDLSGFFLIIVGTEPPPDGLYVELFTRTQSFVLRARTSGASTA